MCQIHRISELGGNSQPLSHCWTLQPAARSFTGVSLYSPRAGELTASWGGGSQRTAISAPLLFLRAPHAHSPTELSALLLIIIIWLPFVSSGSPTPLRQTLCRQAPRGTHVSLFVAAKLSQLLGNVRAKSGLARGPATPHRCVSPFP